MNQQQAIEALEKGKKITHRFFGESEYVHLKSGEIYDEKGQKLRGFFDFRYGEKWNKDWRLFKTK
jgi:hypothetical protein